MIEENVYETIKKNCENNGYVLITKRENIKNLRSKITYICPVHGERTVTASSIYKGCKCFMCTRGIGWKNNKEERSKDLYMRVLRKCEENGYELLTPYNQGLIYESYIKYLCPRHGEKEMKIGNMLSGKRCADCYHEMNREKYKLSTNEVIARAKMVGSDILNPEEYVNNSTKNLIAICPRCGNRFVTSLSCLTQHGGQVCSYCFRKESIGEYKIRKHLETNSIPFIQEKWFADCRDSRHLIFDFYLPSNNICIEFDGEQHYKDNHYFNYDIARNKRHDEIKTKYCETNNIKLIRIPYWKIDKIDTILNSELA